MNTLLQLVGGLARYLSTRALVAGGQDERAGYLRRWLRTEAERLLKEYSR